MSELDLNRINKCRTKKNYYLSFNYDDVKKKKNTEILNLVINKNKSFFCIFIYIYIAISIYCIPNKGFFLKCIS